MFARPTFFLSLVQTTLLLCSVEARIWLLERDGRAIYGRSFGQAQPPVLRELAAACGGGVCNALAVEAVTPLLANQPECSQQDMADKIIDASRQFDPVTQARMVAAAVNYRRAERNTPPSQNSVFCQKAPKNSELAGVVQAQDPSNDPNRFFDPASGNTVTLGSQNNTFPPGANGAKNPTDDVVALGRRARPVPRDMSGSAKDMGGDDKMGGGNKTDGANKKGGGKKGGDKKGGGKKDGGDKKGGGSKKGGSNKMAGGNKMDQVKMDEMKMGGGNKTSGAGGMCADDKKNGGMKNGNMTSGDPSKDAGGKMGGDAASPPHKGGNSNSTSSSSSKDGNLGNSTNTSPDDSGNSNNTTTPSSVNGTDSVTKNNIASNSTNGGTDDNTSNNSTNSVTNNSTSNNSTSSNSTSSNSTNAGNIGNFGSCSVPQIKFGAGFDGRRETAFEPVDQASYNHGSAQNIDIITQFMCDQLVNTCKADATAKSTCAKATTAADGAPAKTGQQADAFNAVFGITTNFASVTPLDDQGQPVNATSTT